MNNSPGIFTIGYSGLTIAKFIDLLNFYQIEIIADIRRYPNSKYNYDFNQGVLISHLTNVNIKYIWFGSDLGGYREQGYKEYMQKVTFKESLKKLQLLASKNPTALMCLEKNYTACHRRFIADELFKQSWHISHILDFNKIVKHKIQESLFNTEG